MLTVTFTCYSVDNSELATLSDLLGCVSSALPSTYLGLLSALGATLCEPVIHKFSKRSSLGEESTYLLVDE